MSVWSGVVRLSKDPTLKAYGEGDYSTFVCNFRGKVQEWRNKKNDNAGDDGDWVDKGFWVNVSVFGSNAEAAAKLLKKGRRADVINARLTNTPYLRKVGEGEKEIEVEVDSMNLDTAYVGIYLGDIASVKYKEQTSPDTHDEVESTNLAETA